MSEERHALKLEPVSTEFDGRLMGTDIALTRTITRDELEQKYGSAQPPLPYCRNCGGQAPALTNGWCDGCLFVRPSE